jgi:hypothetical protein
VLRVIALLGLSDQLAVYPSLEAAFMPAAASDRNGPRREQDKQR